LRRDYSLSSDWPVALFLVFTAISLLAITSYYHYADASRSATGQSADGQNYPIRFSILAEPSHPVRQIAPEEPDAPAPDRLADIDTASGSTDTEPAQPAGGRAVGLSSVLVQQTSTQTAGPAAAERALPQPGRNGVIPLSFDLSDLTSGSTPRPSRGAKASDIEIRKKVQAGGQDLGEITVRVDKYSRLAVDTAQLRTVLKEQPKLAESSNKLPESGMIGFTELRNRGVDLRYDPVADRLTLQSSG